jgi:hypothetical protein
MTTVKGFANTCYKSKKNIVRGIIYPKNKESIQSHKRVITSLIKIKLRQS